MGPAVCRAITHRGRKWIPNRLQFGPTGIRQALPENELAEILITREQQVLGFVRSSENVLVAAACSGFSKVFHSVAAGSKGSDDRLVDALLRDQHHVGIDDVGRLVADALHCEPERARPLTQLVHEKTEGNPFFAIQFVAALLWFDPVAQAWQWDIDRIRARSYTDNVVELMAKKLKRLSATTQAALKDLACLGNVAEIATLTVVQGKTEQEMDAVFWESVHAGLVFRLESAYKFLHDRIQEASYSLIPETQRAEVHLRIGRMLLAGMTADGLAEHLFDIANQFNRGAARLIARDEKVQVATIDLRAGRKAKASVAYASACVYLAAGMALLNETDWGSQYDLMFSLWLERAECELRSGNFEKAERLILDLPQRGASKIDQAAVCQVKVPLHTVKSENPQAVASALTGLCLFGTECGSVTQKTSPHGFRIQCRAASAITLKSRPWPPRRSMRRRRPDWLADRLSYDAAIAGRAAQGRSRRHFPWIGSKQQGY